MLTKRSAASKDENNAGREPRCERPVAYFEVDHFNDDGNFNDHTNKEVQ